MQNKIKCFSSLKNFSCRINIFNKRKFMSCISMTNKECKVRPEIINVNSNELVFFPFSIKRSNAVVVATISMIHMQKCVFLML